MLIYGVYVFVLALAFYNSFIKRTINYNQLVRRSVKLTFLRLNNLAIDNYIYGLQNLKLTRGEIRDINFELGVLYYKVKQLDKSVQYFYKAFNGYNCDFLFREEFNIVITAFIKYGDKEKFEEILNLFLKQEKFDSRFQVFKKYKDVM